MKLGDLWRVCIIATTLAANAACLSGTYTNQSQQNAASELAISSQIDQQITDALIEFEAIQGLSIAVYTPSGIYVQGFGVTDLDTGEKTTKDTAFYVASSTKSMVAIALAAMHERGAIDLDSTLSEFAPDAPFPTNTYPDQVTLRDLLSQSSGLTNEAIEYRLAYSGQYDTQILNRLVATTQPNIEAPLGVFEYTNSNFNLLTFIIEQKLGLNWKDMLADELFDKAGMTHTTTYMSEALGQKWSLARPHSTIGPGAPKRTYLEKTDATMHSAGGVVMSAADAVKWLELLVEDGRIAGRQIVPSDAITASRAPNVEVGKTFGPYDRDHYGLGFYIGPYGENNHQLVHHFGGFSGAAAHVSYMPDQKIGVAVFANDNDIGGRLIHLIANYIYDTLTGRLDAGSTFDSRIERLAAMGAAANAKALARADAAATRQWTLSHSLADYVGRYENNLMGTMAIVIDGSDLRFSIGNLNGVAYAGTEELESVSVDLVPGSTDIIRFEYALDETVDSLVYQGNIFEKR